MKTDNQQIKKTIENLLKLMGVAFDSVEIRENAHTASPRFVIKTADSAILIGARGANLLAFNHLVKKMVMKENEGDEEDEKTRFFVDINNYQEKLEEELKNKAKIMSERARSFKVDIELDPMSSYERMIVHSSLQNLSDIKTESRGLGRDRRVVIKYVEPAKE